jgi:hypothetical protein
MVRARSFEKHWGSRALSVEIEQMSSGAIGSLDIYLRSIQSGQNLGSTGSKLRPKKASVRDKILRFHCQLHLLLSNQVARPCLRSSLPTYSETPKRTRLGLELSSQQRVGSAHNPQGKEVLGVLRGQVGSCSIGILTRGENMGEMEGIVLYA